MSVWHSRAGLHANLTQMITQCDMRHLYDAVPKDEDLIVYAKRFERRRCGHHELEQPLSSFDCLESCVGKTNKHRYIVATQDPKIRAHMRQIPGVPLVYVNKSVMILEPMATASEDQREREEKQKFRAGLKGRRDTGQKRKRDDEDDMTGQGTKSIEEQSTEDSRSQKKKRAKGPKAPNPLSMKKSKKPPQAEPHGDSAAKSKTAKQEAPSIPMEDASGQASIAEGGEAKRKRKRKHKPKGEGGGGVALAEVDAASP